MLFCVLKYSASSRFFPRQVAWLKVGFFGVDIEAGRARHPHKDVETFVAKSVQTWVLWLHFMDISMKGALSMQVWVENAEMRHVALSVIYVYIYSDIQCINHVLV